MDDGHCHGGSLRRAGTSFPPRALSGNESGRKEGGRAMGVFYALAALRSMSYTFCLIQALS
jgi:hypothetical protein